MDNPTDSFTIFPAIDLRQGRVVRLSEGDPDRQTTYAAHPANTARAFLAAGARWLHVVNLDGAFGENGVANMQALSSILSVADAAGAYVQFGGGLRTQIAITRAFEMGVTRVVLGTAVVEQPDLLETSLSQWGPQRIVAGLDARNGLLQVRGWQGATQRTAMGAARQLARQGVIRTIFTDIARDGLQGGLNLESTVSLAKGSGLAVIASGGVATAADVKAAREAGLEGVIIGRALYEGSILLKDLFPSPWEP